MYIDQLGVFSDSQAATFTTSTASTNIIDLTGGAGTTGFNAGVNVTAFGEDIGAGGPSVAIPRIWVSTGAVAPATTNSATLNVQIQGSTDSSTWTTMIETGPIAAASLTANTRVAVIDWPTRLIAQALPRYVRLNYALPASTSFSGNTNSTISAVVTLGPDTAYDTIAKYGSNYQVGA